MKKYILIVTGIISLTFFSYCEEIQSTQILSPDSNISFDLITEGGLYYSVKWKGQQLIQQSALGLIAMNENRWYFLPFMSN